MGTAFGLLLLLTFAITTIGWLFGPDGRFAVGTTGSASDEPDEESHDKALAAVVAVSALLGKGDEAEAVGETGT